MGNTFKISVVMAVYNVESFLQEAIDSLVEQDIGFESIQVILVDDGSTDGSGRICDENAEKYSENIIALHKENGGVSSARNMGMKYVRGKYVNFLDGDDKLSRNACRLVYDFFEKHIEETDLVCIPLYVFDGGTGGHRLNYKFDGGARVIDLNLNWDMPQLSIASCFVRADIMNEFCFDTRLFYAEDAQLIQKLLLRRCTMGVVSEACYRYRIRSTGEHSAMQSGIRKKSYYVPYIHFFCEEVFRYCKEQVGRIPKFVQFCVAYALQDRIMTEKIPEGVLTEEENREYVGGLYGLLNDIDDEVIEKQRNITIECRQFLIWKKHGDDFLLSQLPMKLDFLEIENHRCILEGRIYFFISEMKDMVIQVEYNGVTYNTDMRISSQGVIFLGEKVMDVFAFKAEIPLADDGTIRVKGDFRRKSVRFVNKEYTKFFPVSNCCKNEYYTKESYVVRIEGNGIRVQKMNALQRVGQEGKLLVELLMGRFYGFRVHKASRKAIVVRLVVIFLRMIRRRPLWLVSDRATHADDNNLSFFLYMRQNHPKVDVRFVVSKRCPDYQKIKAIGPVLDEESLMYKLYSLCAEFIISSDGEAFTPFIGRSPYRDLADQKFVFLQNGVTKDDLLEQMDWYKKKFFVLNDRNNSERVYEKLIS